MPAPATTDPSRRGSASRVIWILAVATTAILGVAIGLGAFTFVHARGAAYLTNDPRACANCHVMREHFDAWRKSSHHAVAVCNDCHAPPGGLPKYWTKAVNGFFHSVAFTSGDFHEPIQITERNRRVTEAQCRRCHEPIVAAIDTHGGRDGMSCLRCHGDVGHRVRE
jgi:cytochrome c nitrite reductase small subunit